MRTLSGWSFVLFIMCVCVITWGAHALALGGSNHYAATVRCPSMAEDSAAHVRLVVYDPPRIVYRCERNGY